MHLLVSPVFIFIYREPISIAKSSCKHDGRIWEVEKDMLLKVANNHTNKVKKFQASLGESYEFSVEEIHKNPEKFIESLSEIIPVDSEKISKMRSFVNPGGGYRKKQGNNKLKNKIMSFSEKIRWK